MTAEMQIPQGKGVSVNIYVYDFCSVLFLHLKSCDGIPDEAKLFQMRPNL